MPFFLHRDIWKGRPGNDAFLLTTEFVYTFWGVIELILLLAHTIASDIAHVDQKSFTSSKNALMLISVSATTTADEPATPTTPRPVLDQSEEEDDDDDSEEDDTDEEEEESGEALTILKEVLTENRDVLHQKPPRWQDGE